MPLFHVHLVRKSERIVMADTETEAIQRAREDAAWEDFSCSENYDPSDVIPIQDPENYAPRSGHPRCRIWEPKNLNNED
jgi:hypothetical protein